MQLKKQFDYNEIGGAPVLGARKPVFKAHGDATATTIKNAIGLAIQYANLDVVSKIENNIQMGEAGEIMPYLKAVCFDREVEDMSEGMQTLIGSGGVRLSGGQAQRLALARTLYHKKPVFILDDPFSALDKQTEQEVFASLRELTKDCIVLLISHRLYLFPEMDKVIWLENGWAQSGTHEELMQKVPEYSKLYHAQEDGSKGEGKK